MEKRLLDVIKGLGIKELEAITNLHLLNGDFINLLCELPNGKTEKILDDTKKYYANQVEIVGSDKCYGIAADEKMVAVYKYGCNGNDAELILWKKYG